MSYIVPRDKPKRCKDCNFMDRISYDCRLSVADYPDFYSQYANCPLISIPAEHGGLIDRIELADKVKEVAYPIVHGVNNHEPGITVFGLQMLISEMNVVVPAEWGEREKENL